MLEIVTELENCNFKRKQFNNDQNFELSPTQEYDFNQNNYYFCKITARFI